MAVDYVPVFIPSRVVTLTASGLISPGDLLIVSGSGTVSKCAAEAAQTVVGVAGNDATVNTLVTLYARGYVHESVAEGTVTAGDQVVSSAAAGRQVKTLAAAATATAADINQARAVIGVALITAADGAKVRWMQT